MPWQLPEFLAQRVARAERLLAEDERYRGSADVQTFVEEARRLETLQRFLLNDDGTERAGLTLQEGMQALVAFLRYAEVALGSTWFLCSGSLAERLPNLVEQVQTQFMAQSGGSSQIGPAMTLLVHLSSKAELTTFQAPGDTPNSLAVYREHALDSMGPDWAPWAAAAGHLERYQLQRGFSPVITAEELHRLFLLARHVAAYKLWYSSPGQAQQAAGQQAEAAVRQLEALRPGNAFLLLHHALYAQALGRPAEAARLLRQSLADAEASKAYSTACRAAHLLAGILTGGAGEATWSLAEVKGLLARTEGYLALCKPWAPDKGKSGEVELRLVQERVAALESQFAWLGPRLPAARLTAHLAQQGASCSGCDQRVAALRHCSGCRVAAYCSRECQARHWKQGGHKQECARLAAERAAGREAGSGSAGASSSQAGSSGRA